MHKLWIILLLVFLNSCLSDLRPKEKNGAKDRSIQDSSELLLQAAIQHGYKFWVATPSYSCQITDTFYGSIGKLANPLSGNKAEFKAIYPSGSMNGELEFSSPKGETNTWIYENGKAYLNSKSTKISKKTQSNIAFWVPTYKYFIEFPYRIIEADATKYLGTEDFSGEVCHKVLASWKSVEPQDDIDQYIVWINEKYEIRRIDYTVREQYKFIKGTAVFEEYVKFHGYDVPAEVHVYSSLTGKKALHHMSFSNYELLKLP